MTAVELLAELRGLDVTITTDGADLDLDGPEDVLTDELLGLVAANKAGLLSVLTGPADAEADWRLTAMLDQMARWQGGGIPFLVARREVEVRAGDCLSCGQPLPPDRNWRCAACVEAATLAVSGR